MNLIKDLEPFEKELMLYRRNYTKPQGAVKDKLIDIYEKHYPNYKKWGVVTIKRGCGGCFSDCMARLSAEWVYRPTKTKANKTVEFKGIPQSKPALTVEGLKAECDKRGIKYHHKAGIKKLTELLNV